jgi:ferritin heavy chain
MELALSLEKLNYEKLLKLWDVADKHGDPHAPHWIEDNLLDDQVADIKKAADYVSQLRRIGRDGHGVWHWDYELHQNEIPYRTFQYATGGGDGAVGGVGG